MTRSAVPRTALVAALALAALPCGAHAQAAGAGADLLRRGDDLRARGDSAGAIAAYREAVSVEPTSARTRFHLAYALLAARRTAEAITTFHDGLRLDSTFAAGHRQLGYLYSAEGSLGRAVAAFGAAQALGAMTPHDWLELGYLHARRREGAPARAAFTIAASGADSAVRVRAFAAADELRAGASGSDVGVPFAEAYAAPFYQTRFTNVIAQAVVRAGMRTTVRAALTPYVSLRVTRDARSVGGVQPEIFSDNVVVPALGVRVQPLGGALTVYGEAGPAVALLHGAGGAARADVRAGGYYFGAWSHGRTSAYRPAAPLTTRGELYVDAAYYSRFEHDVIGYVQLRELLDVVRLDVGSVELFARAGGVADSRRVSYNNTLELGGGVGLAPGRTRRVVINLERVHGRYLAAAVPGTARRYGDTRLTAVFYARAAARPGTATR